MDSKTARRKSAAQRETGEELEQHRVKETHWAPNVTLELTWVNSVPCVAGSTNEKAMLSFSNKTRIYKTNKNSRIKLKLMNFQIYRFRTNYIIKEICHLSLLAHHKLVYGATVILKSQLLIRGLLLMNPYTIRTTYYVFCKRGRDWNSPELLFT